MNDLWGGEGESSHSHHLLIVCSVHRIRRN